MNLKSLLVSSDDKTVRILRRVLGDLEISVDHCATANDAIRKITRQRFEAIIVDAVNTEEAGHVLRGAKAAPANKRALAIVLVEAAVGMKGGFEMGAHFVLHKPFAVERAKASFRAVRALMKRERRLQMRVPVEIPISCFGSKRYTAKTLDLCEGGMAIKFSGRITKETMLRFSLELPGTDRILELHGELAWEGQGNQAGVRFQNATDEQRKFLRRWLDSQLPEPEEDDPPIPCRVTHMSMGGCYLTTNSPFPRGTRVIFSTKSADARAGGVVLVAHPEHGMGVEFLQSSAEQQEQAQRLITSLRASGHQSPVLHVEPDGLETALPEDGEGAGEDALVDLFRQKFTAPVESFLEQMRGKSAIST